jgi:hypothetical protein
MSSTPFAYFLVLKSGVLPGQINFRNGFDSRQRH